MISIIFLGFLIGMQHALEADHIAAVASLATRNRSVKETVKQGVTWGLGHAITLFLFGGLVVVMDTVVSEHVAQGLELAVGFMLVLLGLDVLRRLIRGPHPLPHPPARRDTAFPCPFPPTRAGSRQ